MKNFNIFNYGMATYYFGGVRVEQSIYDGSIDEASFALIQVSRRTYKDVP